MPNSLPIAGVVIAMNEADRIVRCVSSLAELCAEVIVLDSGSTDATVALARQAGARVEYQQWLGFARQRNASLALVTQPWVLMLDADEWLAEGAEARIRQLFATKQVESADIWRLQRRTRFLGTALRFGGWGREAVGRLFRSDIRYLPLLVHERHDASGKRQHLLQAGIEHDTARSAAEYREKLDRYAFLFARQRYRGCLVSPLAAFTHSLSYVLKNCVLRGGILDGPTAWHYHALHARYVWRKYSILHALQILASARTSALQP